MSLYPPETQTHQWVGMVKGVVVATYPNRWDAEAALERYDVQSIAPKGWHHS